MITRIVLIASLLLNLALAAEIHDNKPKPLHFVPVAGHPGWSVAVNP